jgi:c(7)-type cytochrome triheme protein
MRKALVVALLVLIVAAFIGTALAVPPGKDLVFKDGAMGQVTFSGKTHADAGAKCMDCHPKVFAMKFGTMKLTLADHKPGKFCGVCHDGNKAFAQKGNCTKCHKK